VKKFLFLIVVVVVTFSCAKDDQMALAETRSLESYLNQTNYAGELPCDTLDDGVWRLLENDREGRDDAPRARAGSVVEFFYEGYAFVSSLNLNPGIEERPAPFATNRAEIIGALGLDPRLWPTGPEAARLGAGELFMGLDRGLQGTCEGDSVLLLMTSGNGYGEKSMMTLPSNSPLVFRVFVNDVR
jgi:hypothetical protein